MGALVFAGVPANHLEEVKEVYAPLTELAGLTASKILPKANMFSLHRLHSDLR